MVSSMWLRGGLSPQLVTNGIMVTVSHAWCGKGRSVVLGAGCHLMDWDVVGERERASPQTQS